jgi:hypothetical protein
MDINSLKSSLSSVNTNITLQLKRITKPYAECEKIGHRLWLLVQFYPSRAMLSYLLDGDIQKFFGDLNREALTYITLLQSYKQQFDGALERVKPTTFYPIISALAAGNYEAAKIIDRLMPSERRGADAKSDFAYTRILRNAAIENWEAAENELDEFFSSASKDADYSESHIKAVASLVKKEELDFNNFLKDYLDSFNDLSEFEIEELDPGAEYIRIDALAYIELAKKRDMKVTIEHNMIPKELQSPRLIIPDLDYPDWPV